MSTTLLVVGGVILSLLLLFLVVGTLVTLGKLFFILEYHFHHLQMRQNLRFYHKTKGFMTNTGVGIGEDEELLRFYTKNFHINEDLELQQKTRTVLKDGKEVQEEVSVWCLKEDHSESESESMNELQTPGLVVLTWYGLVGLSILTIVTVILSKIDSLSW